MAVESPAWANAIGSYTAEQTRRAVFAAYARTGSNSPGIIAGGLLSAADLQMTAPGSGMSVNVSTGEAIIGGSEGGAQGGYYARATSTTNLSIAAANATNPRIDTVCATISDAGYTEPTGGSGNQWALQVVTGTATVGATLVNLTGAAALPLSSLLLGYVLVPALSTNVITGNISNRATVVPLLAGSNFLRLPTGNVASVTWGVFATGTGVVATAGSGDWTLSALSTGLATVNFPSRAITTPAVLVTAFFNATPTIVQVDAITSATAQIGTTQGGSVTNSSVSFAVIG